jgi:hypothetical protein
MGERGEYRAIRRVLLDGPDFQRLSERARFVFLALKLNIGPTGIEVHYPAALAFQVAEQTGVPPGAVMAALDELRAGNWLRLEANVIWIIGQLDNDPHMTAQDGKHRKSVCRHIAGLPRLAIVREFIEAHPSWFIDADAPDSDSLPPKALPRPSEGPSKALGSTEDRIPKTEYQEPKTDNQTPITDGVAVPAPSAGADSYSADFLAAWAEYPRRAGANSKGAAWRQWRARIKQGVPAADMIAGTKRYAAFCHATDKLGTEYVKQAATFFGRDRHYAEAWEPPPPEMGRIKPGSEAAGIRADRDTERPQYDRAGRTGTLSLVSDRPPQQPADDGREQRIDAWIAANREHAERLLAEVQAETGSGAVPGALQARIVNGMLRGRIWALLQDAAA